MPFGNHLGKYSQSINKKTFGRLKAKNHRAVFSLSTFKKTRRDCMFVQLPKPSAKYKAAYQLEVGLRLKLLTLSTLLQNRIIPNPFQDG